MPHGVKTDEEIISKGKALLRDGKSRAEVARILGLSASTVRYWQAQMGTETTEAPAEVQTEQAPEAPAEDDGPRLSTSPLTPAVAVMEAILRAPADAPPTDDDLRRIAELHVDPSDGRQAEKAPESASDCMTVPAEVQAPDILPEDGSAPPAEIISVSLVPGPAEVERWQGSAPEAPREPAAAPSPRIKGRVKTKGSKARLRLSNHERARLHIAAADLWLRGIRSPEAMLEKEKPMFMVSIPKIKEWIAEFTARDLAALVAAGEIDHRLLTLFKHCGRPAIKSMVDRHRAAEAVRVPGAPPPKTRKRRKTEAPEQAPAAATKTRKGKAQLDLVPDDRAPAPRDPGKVPNAVLVRNKGEFQRLNGLLRLRALAVASELPEAEVLRRLALIGLHTYEGAPDRVQRAFDEARAAMAGVQS